MNPIQSTQANLVNILQSMGVRLSENVNKLLELDPTSTIGDGPLSDTKVGNKRAMSILKEIISQGYNSIGAYSPPVLDECIDKANEKYGPKNVHVLRQRELSGLPQDQLFHSPGFAYIFIRDELIKEHGDYIIFLKKP